MTGTPDAPITYRASELGLVERRIGALNVAIDVDISTDQGRPVVVLVHGLAGCWQNFAPAIPQLRRRYRVVALDLPGFGASGSLPRRPRCFDFAAVAATIVELLDELEIERVTLVGHSMGAGVAGSVALAAPERVERLVLVGPAGWVHAPWATSRVWRSTVLHWLSRTATWYIGMPLLRALPGVRVRVLARHVQHPEWLTMRDVGALLRGSRRGRSTGPAGMEVIRLGLIDRAAEITTPTVVVTGDHDQVVEPRYAQRIAAAIPGAELVTLPDVGHIPMLEVPAAFAAAVSGSVVAGQS